MQVGEKAVGDNPIKSDHVSALAGACRQMHSLMHLKCSWEQICINIEHNPITTL